MKISGIYMLEHIATGRRYVGKAADLWARVWQHLRATKSGTFIANAIRKHGAESFVASILERCPVGELAERERFWIAKMNTRAPHGFNLTDGGEGSFGRVISEETRARMVAAQLGKKRSSEEIARRSATIKGRIPARNLREISSETRAKLSASLVGNRRRRGSKASDETRALMSAAHIGKKHSEETLAKMRAAQQKRRMKEREASWA